MYRKLHGSRSINEKSYACLAPEMLIIPRVRSTSGIINISPNTSEIFREYFENKCNFLLIAFS